MLRRWLSQWSITRKIVAASLVIIALFLAGFVLSFLPQVEESLLAERRLLLQERTELILGLLRQYEVDIHQGALTPEEAQQRAMRRLRGISLDRGQYFWVMDTQRPSPQVLLHPAAPFLEGGSPNTLGYGVSRAVRHHPSGQPELVEEAPPIQVMSDICHKDGQGFVSYTWPKATSQGGYTAELFPKECYVALFKPWGWIVGTGEYVDDLHALLDDVRMSAFFFLAFATALAVIVASLMAASITKPLRRMVEATQSIARGDLDVRAGIEMTSNEVAQLSSNFDEMVRQLLLREQEREVADKARRDSERKMLAAFQNSFQLIWLLTPDGELLQCNRSAQEYLGSDEEPLSGRPFWETPWWSDKPEEAFRLHAALSAAMGGDFIRFETTFHHPRSGLRAIDFSISAVCDDTGAVRMLLAEGRDVTESRAMENRLNHMGLHDPLTGLANRSLLTDRVHHALQLMRQRQGAHLALLYIDINRFRIINDSLGHVAGDAILRDVASILLSCVRETDTVARFGGDDFVILLWELPSIRSAVAIAKNIRQALAAPLGPQANPISIKVSIGMDLMLHESHDADDVVRNAHLALSHCKAKGRGFLKVYTPSMLSRVRASLMIENEMERGIREGEFFLLFQPIMENTPQPRLAGYEALCRWNHPKKGLIPPDEFIPVAEETAQIAPLGQWVLETACQSLAELTRMRPECQELFLAVNLSPIQLKLPDIVQTVREALENHHIAPSRLHLEVTETSVMSGNRAMLDNILRLKELGVHMVVDDFGTGYSNLALLTHIRFSAIKIDRSLVRQVQHVFENQSVIRAILTMAESLGAKVIAEGVETLSQRDMLMAMGCQLHQGFHYARPSKLEVIAGIACN